MGYEITGERGKVILVGVPKKSSNISIHSLPLHFGKTIQGTHGGEVQPDDDIPRYLSLLEAKKWSNKDFISDRYSLDNINLAIDSMRNGSTSGRVMISPE